MRIAIWLAIGAIGAVVQEWVGSRLGTEIKHRDYGRRIAYGVVSAGATIASWEALMWVMSAPQ